MSAFHLFSPAKNQIEAQIAKIAKSVMPIRILARFLNDIGAPTIITAVLAKAGLR
jgi:hypothetical protein